MVEIDVHRYQPKVKVKKSECQHRQGLYNDGGKSFLSLLPN